MTILAIYLFTGLLAYIWLYNRTKEGFSSAVGFSLFSDVFGILICSILWPIMIPFFVIEGQTREEELKVIENRKEYVPEDLGLLKGKIGEALTPQSPSGKALVEGKEYESRSILAFIPKGSNIRVVGHSMHHLQIEPADPVGGDQ